MFEGYKVILIYNVLSVIHFVLESIFTLKGKKNLIFAVHVPLSL